MQINFSSAAVKEVQAYLNSDTRILLDFDDGVGPFSHVATCSLDAGFGLLFVTTQMDTHEYNQKISSNLGPIYIKDYSATQLDEDMQVRFNQKYAILSLQSDHRIITPNLELIDLHQADGQLKMDHTHDC